MQPVVALLLIAVLTPSAVAQLQFDELGKRHLPPVSDFTTSVASGDVDGDGDLDLVFGNHTDQNRLYLNDGTGIYCDATPARMPAAMDPTNAVVLGDVDGDADLDLVSGNAGQNRLYLNDGAGAFSDATALRMPADSDSTYALSLADLDGDGDLDLLVANNAFPAQRNRLYINDGTGTFVDATAARLPADADNTSAVAVGDVDADGDPDVVFGNSAQNRLYLNDGTGTFTDGTAGRLPLLNDATAEALLADLDGDSDPDLVFGNSGQDLLYLNDGTGVFTDATSMRMPVNSTRTSSAAVGDVDGDGDLDLVFGIAFRQNYLYLNDGSAVFTAGFPLPVENARSLALSLADVDGDGDPDLVTGNGASPGQRNRLYFNDGSGRFVDGTSELLAADNDATRAIVMGDVDGDGDSDLISGNDGDRNRLYLNDGTGILVESSAARMPSETDLTQGVVLSDLDGDGDLDLAIANSGRNRLYLNGGPGTFANAPAGNLPSDSDFSECVVSGDVDGDGDVDLIFGNLGQNRLYTNSGNGVFSDVTATHLPSINDLTEAAALGDVDGDGDLDLVFGNAGQQDRLYENDGAGVFSDVTAARMPPDSGNTFGLVLGDVDGDGDPDLVLGRQGQDALYLNDGSGTFMDATPGRMPVDSDATLAVGADDVDMDGDLDLVFGNIGSFMTPADRLSLNDGTGRFSDTTRLPHDRGATEALAIGDVDGDGDPDLVFGKGGGIEGERNRLCSNLLRQIDSPFLVLPGRDYRLDVFARYGSPRLVDVALPYVSPRTARTPLPPFGTVGLDPSFLIPLQPLVVPQPAGVQPLFETIPNSPALVGLSVHAQTLLLQWPGPAFLTNVTTDRIAQ